MLGLQSRASLLGQRYIIFNTLFGMCVIKHTNLCRRFAKLVRPRPQTIVCFITLPFYTFPLSPGTYHPVGRPHYSRCLECQQGRVPSHLNQFATRLISLQSLPHTVSVVQLCCITYYLSTTFVNLCCQNEKPQGFESWGLWICFGIRYLIIPSSRPLTHTILNRTGIIKHQAGPCGLA